MANTIYHHHHHHHQLHLFVLVFICLFSCTLQDDACRRVECGQGRCVADDDGFSHRCECNRGWKRMMVAPMPYPSCIVPNCSMDFSCGGKDPPLPPPRPRSPINATNACSLVWCGAGDCVAKGTTHHCRCHDEADNLFDNSAYICVKKCYFKADCNHLGHRPTSPTPPSPASSVGSPISGRSKITYTVTEFLKIGIVVFTTTILAAT